MNHNRRYQKQAEYAEKILNQLTLRRERLVSVRWIIFFLILGIWGALLFCNIPGYYLPTGIAAGVVLFITSSFVSKLSHKMDRWEHYKSWQGVKLARAQLNWGLIPAPREVSSERLRDLDTQTAVDIGLVGNRSLVQLLDTTITDEGQRVLHRYLGDDQSLDHIRFQQTLIQELEAADVFRNRFRLGGTQSSTLIQISNLRESFATRLQSSGFRLLVGGLWVLQLLNLGLIFAVQWFNLKPYYLFSLTAVYLAQRVLRGFAADPLESGLAYQKALEKVMPLLSLLENLSSNDHGPSSTVVKGLKSAPPSRALARISTVVSLLGVKANPLLALTLNFLVPWDFMLLMRLETLRLQNARDMGVWVETLAQMDAAVAVAEYSLNLDGNFPEYTSNEADPFLEATDLGHPLIPVQQRVTNSLKVDPASPVALVTGSNMAGKSTFLKTIGLVIVLGKLGSRIPGTAFRLRNFQLISLIKAQDYLEKEMSLFFYEVSRLKTILEKAQAATPDAPVFFLIDEIYRGTNNQERYQGAVAYLKTIANLSSTCGLLTTHDISVAETLESLTLISNYHFSEVFQDGKLVYNYRIHTGICRSTNALRIMAREKLPVS